MTTADASSYLVSAAQAWVRITPTVLQALDQKPYVVLSLLPGAQCSQNRCGDVLNAGLLCSCAVVMQTAV